MHHLYPLAKGDQLCPLGFHPQVRWPTRCKRCFRDYKEHGGKRGGEDIASSSPSLSDTRYRENGPNGRSWTSTQNLSTSDSNANGIELRKRPSSWTSTPDLDDSAKGNGYNKNSDVSVSVEIPQRRHTTILDAKELEESFTMRRPPIPPSASPSKEISEELTILKTDSLAERVRKMNLLKKQNSTERESSRERSVPRKIEKEKSPSIERKPTETNSIEKVTKKKETSTTTAAAGAPPKKTVKIVSKLTASRIQEEMKTKQDVQFLIHVKKQNSITREDDSISTTTETTDTTLVDPNDKELQDEIKELKNELELMKTRAERAERDKSDILLRRLASLDTGTNRTAASEALKLQQKVNELKTQLEEVKDDKRCLTLKVKELEKDLDSRPAKNIEDELRRKLQAAEQLCEELMDENEDVKKELHGMEQEIDEMHDNFREDQVEEFTTIRKDLEQTTKNCRILSFKLKKSERKIDQLENEKKMLGTQNSTELVGKIKKLEEELKMANDLARRLKTEAEESKNPNKKKTPSLGVIGKSTSADGKFSRESLTRGGSQDDPVQLLRDLQDSMEREADLKEQLKFAEEEAESLRKKASRVDDENESLMMQLKKMASRARSRKLSPTPSRLTPEPPVEHDEGISDEDDPAELRVLLELNEQEASILRQKVEDLETENLDNKNQIRELQDKLKMNTKESSGLKKLPSFLSKTNQSDKKLKILEDELSELRKNIVDKDRNIERLHAEITATKTKTNTTSNSKNLIKTNSIEDKVDLKRQLEVVEQEATILRNKITKVEEENDKLSLENKKLQLQSLRKNSTTGLAEKNGLELMKIKESLSQVEKERDELNTKLKTILEDANDKLPPRIPKKFTDLTPKTNLRKMIDELEDEIKEMRAIVVRSGSDKIQKIETEKNSIQKDLKQTKDQLTLANSELKKLKASKDNASVQATKISELEEKFKKSEEESSKLNVKIKDLEDKIKKQDSQIKQTESSKSLLENQIKRDKDKMSTLEKDMEKVKKERQTWESKVAELNDELITTRKNYDKQKSLLEKEIQELKTKSGIKIDSVTNRKLQELRKQNDDYQQNLTKEIKRYSELNARFETLEEDNVLMKAQHATEKQNLETELKSAKQKLSEIDILKCDKSELMKKLKDTQKRLQDIETKNIKTGSVQYEKNILKNSIVEKDQALEKLRKENEMNTDFATQIRKENEELRKKLDDFQRVNKAQRSLNDHNSNLETEIKKLKIRLENSELTSKSEIASTRLRYEQQVKNVQAELNSMQRQCERFKKDRDTFKQLLESAQKTIGDLKQHSGRQSRSSMNSGDEDDKSKITYLEQQVGCLEDQLSESRLEMSRLKTELISERSANEIKISEMTSKLNEYEEDRLIGSGRTKIAGMKTKLELSWQKEREDQQRLIQETSTLARDLRQTLFEVERELDKERLESKRRMEQLKRANEEELDEGRKKISELQCDLLELRDAHAKLRTSNEKLRRERERNEREMVKRRLELDGERKVGALLQTVDELVKIAPDLQLNTKSKTSSSTQQNLKPTDTVKRTRSPSPGRNTIQISSVLARLTEASEELRRFQRFCEDEKERDKSRRSGMRRATSTETENQSGIGAQQRISSTGKILRSSTHNGSLYRKSLSLDHSIQKDQSFWRQDQDDSMSSIQSIDSELGGRGGNSSMDSRLSGGSTQSDIPRGPRKKKRGLMTKLRSLTKSGNKTTESEGSVQGSDSDISVSSDIRSSKKDLKERLSGMFKRSSSQTRNGSSERINDSQQRPVAVTIVGADDGKQIKSPTTPKTIRNVSKPPSSSSTTPSMLRKPK